MAGSAADIEAKILHSFIGLTDSDSAVRARKKQLKYFCDICCERMQAASVDIVSVSTAVSGFRKVDAKKKTRTKPKTTADRKERYIIVLLYVLVRRRHDR